MSNNQNNIQQYQGAAPVLQFDQGKIDTIRNTVAKGATNNELEMFLHLCSTYQLDPFRKEIWFIKYNGQQGEPTIMTSRDGYLKIAQSQPDYQGIMSAEVRENDYFEMDPGTGTVIHKFAQPITRRGTIVGAWATVKRKGFDPVSVFVNYEEYKGNSKIWRQYPSAMIIKVAESFALKRQFGITGLVTREEMDAQHDGAPEMPQNDFQGPSGPNSHEQHGSSNVSQSEQPQSDPDPNDLIPSNNDVTRAADILGWNANQMLTNVNTFLRKNHQPEVKRWADLAPRFKAAFYQLMMNRIQKEMEDMGGERK